LESIDLADAEFGLAQINFILIIAQGDAGEKAVEGNFSGIVVLTQYIVPVSLDHSVVSSVTTLDVFSLFSLKYTLFET
jgi:hypothetical protein